MSKAKPLASTPVACPTPVPTPGDVNYYLLAQNEMCAEGQPITVVTGADADEMADACYNDCFNVGYAVPFYFVVDESTGVCYW